VKIGGAQIVIAGGDRAGMIVHVIFMVMVVARQAPRSAWRPRAWTCASPSATSAVDPNRVPATVSTTIMLAVRGMTNQVLLSLRS
jgi:hypothetical protein